MVLCSVRKSRVKRTIRVPAVSSKAADMPPDEFSWRKYGQKPIKGSPYPRYHSIPRVIITGNEIEFSKVKHQSGNF